MASFVGLYLEVVCLIVEHRCQRDNIQQQQQQRTAEGLFNHQADNCPIGTRQIPVNQKFKLFLNPIRAAEGPCRPN